jgi:hypothetical protein
MKTSCLWVVLALPAFAADPLPDPQVVRAAMKKATAFCRDRLAVHGGYASGWKADFSAGITEHKESPTVISIQPPGTTTMGLALVKAFRATGDAEFLKAARAAAGALIECQLASGGWDSDFDFAPDAANKYHLRRQVLAGDAETGKRRNRSTLDDNKTQSALLFLLELAHLPESREDRELQEALRFGLDAVLAAQFPNGAWPQQFSGPADPSTPVKKATYPSQWPRTFPAVKYDGFYTLNDGNMEKLVELMLRAHELTGEARYLESAKKAGEFFILAQMPEPQPAWAQQYDFDMHPVWARKFEPPSVSGGETVGVLRALIDLWVVTGEERFLKPVPSAMKWLEASALPDGRHARFYELQTNKPLYFVKDRYELTYDDGNLPTHYGFQVEQAKSIAGLRERLATPREKLLRDRQGPSSPKSWASKARGAAGKAQRAVDRLRPEGYWSDGGELDARDFVEHLQSMAYYLDAVRQAGDALQGR